jgi:hypothetical protein
VVIGFPLLDELKWVGDESLEIVEGDKIWVIASEISFQDDCFDDEH